MGEVRGRRGWGARVRRIMGGGGEGIGRFSSPGLEGMKRRLLPVILHCMCYS